MRLSGLFLIVPAVAFAAAAPNGQTDLVETTQGALKITPLYHGSVMLDFGGKIIHVDPWSQADYAGVPQADMILITHTHADHMDPAIIKTLKKASTVIVTSAAVADTLNGVAGEVETIGNGEKKRFQGLRSRPSPCTTWYLDHRQGSHFTIKGSATVTYSVLALRGCISRVTRSASPR